MENYIVRIYRCDDPPGSVHGLLESVETGATRPFGTLDELTSILSHSPTPSRQSAAETPRTEPA